MSLQRCLTSPVVRDRFQARKQQLLEIDPHFIALQAEVHRRVASELHDSTCQHLAAASLVIMQVLRSLKDPEQARRLCGRVDASINQALDELRSLTYLLHPRDLADDGLKSAIEDYASGFAARTSLIVKATIAPDVDRLPYEWQCSLLRIVQEGLVNVHRHANATEVVVLAGRKEGHFELEIKDNGKGLTERARREPGRSPTSGIGLRVMRARLREMGGYLEILSGSKARLSGTTLRATIPFAVQPLRNGRTREMKRMC